MTSTQVPAHVKSAVHVPPATHIRLLCAALTAVVLYDAAQVRAPGLALLAVPFLIGVASLARERHALMVLLGLWSSLYVVVGTAWMAGHGFGSDAPGADLLFAYVGTPLAVVLTAAAAVRVARWQNG